MQGIELVAIFSLLSSLFSLFSAPSSLLSSALDSRNRIPAFLQGIMRPRGVLHCKNEAIRGGPGANKPCCQSIWGSLAAFFVISSLFSLLSFLFKPGKVQTLLQLFIRNAAIRDGLGANKPCCQSIWGSLTTFFVISSLCFSCCCRCTSCLLCLFFFFFCHTQR